MFREMRRNKQLLPEEDTKAILRRNTAGVLSVQGDDDYPYGVPISYQYDEEKARLYFHCAVEGHKLDAIAKNPKVSFCVIDQDHIVSEKFTTFFRSAIVFGKAYILKDGEEYEQAIWDLAVKYSPNLTKERIDEEISKNRHRTYMIAVEIEHMTGKEAIELVAERTK